jgi:hypothetical protein
MRVVSFTLRPLYHQGNRACTHHTGGSAAPGGGLDAVEVRTIPCFSQKSNSDPLLAQPETWTEENYDKR